MSPAPRIGQKLSLIPKNSEAAHEVALPPSAPLTPEQVDAEEANKAQLVAKLRSDEAAAQRRLAGTTPASQSIEPTTELAALSLRLTSAEAAERTNAGDQHQKINGPKVDQLEQRLNAAKVAMNKLREEFLDRMTELAAVDPMAIRRAFRFAVTPGNPITAGDLVTLMQRAAESASGTLKCADVFGVATDAVNRARQSSYADPESQQWKMAGDWLRTQINTAESNVTSVAGRIKNALALHDRVVEALKTAPRIDHPVIPSEVEWLPSANALTYLAEQGVEPAVVQSLYRDFEQAAIAHRGERIAPAILDGLQKKYEKVIGAERAALLRKWVDTEVYRS